MPLLPIIVESLSPLQLPPICACCGRAATHAIVVKPKDPSKVGQDLFFEVLGGVLHPLSIYLAIKTLKASTVKIPMCKNCRQNHFLPDRRTLVFVALHILFFVGAFYHGFKMEFGYMFLDLFLAILCLVLVVRKNMRHDLITMPIRVSLHDGKFRYTIYGGPQYSYFNAPQNLSPAGSIKLLR